jgi:16S rRNA (uracil1498-N3)-methyltransferase
MSDRYFADESISSDRVVLAGPEAHHLIHVMRAAPGLQVVLFDGSGDEFPAVVRSVGRSDVELSVLSREQINRELPVELTLCVTLPKGDRQRWLVEKAVELGVTRVIPLRTQRSVAQPVEQSLLRLRRTVIEASKQCGRNRLLEIGQPQAWPDLVEDTAAAPCRLLAHPRMASPTRIFGSEELPDSVLLAIGPEGGFADDEVALAVAAGWHTVDLGPRILRVETAAIALAAMVVERMTH